MHGKKNNISVSGVVLTFNQADNINSCLKSINWCDEIIVVDSYSTDETLGRIKNYESPKQSKLATGQVGIKNKKIKIYKRKLNGDFAGQRNFAVEKATGDWILVLDADEMLPADAKEIIKNLIKDVDFVGFWFRRRNYINEKIYLRHGYFYPDYQLRLFRKKCFAGYKGLVHELPKVEGKTRKIKALEVYHNSSNTKYDSLLSFGRFFPYVKIEGREKVASSESYVRLVSCGLRDLLRDFYWSFIRDKGYKDGLHGFRAALLYGMYRGAVSFYAVILRLKMSL